MSISRSSSSTSGKTSPSSKAVGPVTKSAARGSSSASETGRIRLEPRFLAPVLAHPLSDFYLIVGSAALLLVLGTMMVLSASSVTAYVNFGDAYYYVKRQVAFLFIGIAGCWFLATRQVRTLRVLAWVAFILALVLLMLVFTPLGKEVNGNRNWLDFRLPFMTLQPSEFAKFAMVIWGADVFARKQKLLAEPRHLVVPFIPGAGLLIVLVLLEGDFGTAVVMAAIMLAMLWMVGAPLRLLLGLGALGAAGSFLMVVTSASRLRRFLGFLNPDADALSTNMQPIMAVWALASGGWWGLGLGASRQKWGSLVEAHTDFVFAVIGEELGLVGTLVVLLLFLVLAGAGLRTAMRSDDLFAKYLSAGIAVWFGGQALINIMVVLRLLPVMGVPLPFVSYGGSSLMASLAALGVLICCSRHEPTARKHLARGKGGPKPKMTAIMAGK